MTLDELKRLNNILYRYTGLGKIEKDIDDSIIYHSCYYLDKIFQEICDYIDNSGGLESERAVRIKFKILDEDIDEDGSISHKSGLRDLYNLSYESFLFDGCYISFRLFGGSGKIGDSYQFTLNSDLIERVEENIFEYDFEKSKTFKGFRLDSYELDVATTINVFDMGGMNAGN